MRLYIAGPMTGLPLYNYPAFHAAAQQLQGAGYETENPADNNLHACASWEDYMRAGITQLMRCDGIALLDGAERSRGAILEMRLGQELSMTYHNVDYWLSRATRPEGARS